MHHRSVNITGHMSAVSSDEKTNIVVVLWFIGLSIDLVQRILHYLQSDSVSRPSVAIGLLIDYIRR